MAEQIQFVAATEQRLVHPIDPAVLETRAELATPTPEQVEAADGLFAAPKEGELVAGMVGLWSGALLLHHLAVETFRGDEGEPRRQRKPRPEERPSDGPA